MSAKGKIAAAAIGVGIPLGVLAADAIFFSLNPLPFVGAITALTAGGLYLVSYKEHE